MRPDPDADDFLEKKKKTIKNDYTHISVILDRTGSMEEIRDDTIGGFNSFLGEQKARKASGSGLKNKN